MLEADLWRSEAKIDALANPDDAALMRYRRDDSGEIVAEEKDEVPRNKEEGMQKWLQEMELMFLRGNDPEFDYAAVDKTELYDDWGVQEREEEEKWFEEEEPRWAGMSEEDEVMDDAEEALKGQTGVQDY